MKDTHIRWMIKSDMPEALEIEQTTQNPINEEGLIEWLRQRDIIGLVTENAHEEVIAFIIYALKKKSIEILRIAVHPEWKRQGLATRLIERMQEKIRENENRTKLTVCVHEELLDLQLFLKSQGFQAVTTISQGDKAFYLMQWQEKATKHLAGVMSLLKERGLCNFEEWPTEKESPHDDQFPF